MKRRIKVLIAKPGLDGHDRGAMTVAMGLRDHGMEVIYTGLRQTPENIVRACVQENVDVLGLSMLSGGQRHYVPKIIELLREQKAENVLVLVGGVIPTEDVEYLKQLGVAEVFGPGTRIADIVSFIEGHVRGEGR